MNLELFWLHDALNLHNKIVMPESAIHFYCDICGAIYVDVVGIRQRPTKQIDEDSAVFEFGNFLSIEQIRGAIAISKAYWSDIDIPECSTCEGFVHEICRSYPAQIERSKNSGCSAYRRFK